MKKTVLIFGVSSFVGSNLAQFLKSDYRIIGTYFKTPVNIPGTVCVPCDVLKKDYVQGLIARFKPDITIYCVGMSDLEKCKAAPKQAEAVNTSGAVNCCMASERQGAKFIYLSSGFVMEGLNYLYREGDLPMPVTAYGQSMSSGEFYVQRSCLNYFILRCSPLYGRSYNPEHINWFETVQSNFSSATPFEADDSLITGFLDIYIVAKILKAVIDSGITNRLFQASSSDFMTRYQFALMYAKVFRKDESLVLRGSSSGLEAFSTKSQPKNSNGFNFKMATANLSDFLGSPLPSIEESLQLTFRRLSGKSS